ncbi:hypothetical protein [Thermodesulfovibrio sp. Kuro-1]|uniref:hypothetical protein n=1 Tax=Thermodesulfovibrio sp. Kuro-1 TaxID=2580394 RepID=UPI0011439857|nr:hypothetical protein [Thermodesulfovibrio sp. Kuro-1]
MTSHFKPTKKNILVFMGIFILVSCLLFFLSEYFHDVLYGFSEKIHSLTILVEYLKTSIELTFIFIAVKNWKPIYRWILGKREFRGTGDEFTFPKDKVKAIIIPVSRREQPEWIIRHLEPKYVAFLYTGERKKHVIELINLFSDKVHFVHTLKEIEQGKDMLSDPDNPNETKEIVKKFIEGFIAQGIKEENIFVDTTGGKVPMSIGAFQAAEEMGVSSIYIVGKGNNGNIKEPTLREQGYPIFLSRKNE